MTGGGDVDRNGAPFRAPDLAPAPDSRCGLVGIHPCPHRVHPHAPIPYAARGGTEEKPPERRREVGAPRNPLDPVVGRAPPTSASDSCAGSDAVGGITCRARDREPSSVVTLWSRFS